MIQGQEPIAHRSREFCNCLYDCPVDIEPRSFLVVLVVAVVDKLVGTVLVDESPEALILVLRSHCVGGEKRQRGSHELVAFLVAVARDYGRV